MLSYFLIGLSLVLLGIVGLQFAYMFYLDRIHLEHKRHIHDLEKQSRDLTRRLAASEARVGELESLLDLEKVDEAWADVIEER